MRGLKKGDTVSPETIKKELRTVRAALGIAKRWKYIAEVPTLPEIEGYGKDKPFVTALPKNSWVGNQGECNPGRRETPLGPWPRSGLPRFPASSRSPWR